ncbi:MAG: hypothetical protein GY926_20930 [bacterium]|nr:hypothetical protein [bacterium]MCP4967684.1 hypothetical protein [bacterium]
MPLTLELHGDALARLRAEADRRGVSIDDLVAQLIAGLPNDADRTGGDLGFIGLGSSTSSRRARDADEMLAEGFGRD